MVPLHHAAGTPEAYSRCASHAALITEERANPADIRPKYLDLICEHLIRFCLSDTRNKRRKAGAPLA